MRSKLRGRAILIIPAALGMALVILPLIGLIARTEWGNLVEHLSSPIVWPAIRLSMITTITTLIIAMILGTPLAWLLSRSSGRAASWMRALLTVPVVLPPVVGGVALLLAYGRNGLIGATFFTMFGWRIPYTVVAVILAQVFVSLPFYVLSVEGAMRSVDSRYDKIAATLGASPRRVFIRVALPLAAPGIAAGAALAWARALGEFGATITFAGNLTGRTQTAPLAVYAALQGDLQAAIALSVLMLAVSIAVLGLLRGRWM